MKNGQTCVQNNKIGNFCHDLTDLTLPRETGTLGSMAPEATSIVWGEKRDYLGVASSIVVFFFCVKT